MLAYRHGDSGAFETLYARHKGGLYRFVQRGIKERGIAEELFQEIWVRVIEARQRYAPQARFSTWLYTIAHNRMVDHWRKRGLNVVPLESEGPDDPAPHHLSNRIYDYLDSITLEEAVESSRDDSQTSLFGSGFQKSAA